MTLLCLSGSSFAEKRLFFTDREDPFMISAFLQVKMEYLNENGANGNNRSLLLPFFFFSFVVRIERSSLVILIRLYPFVLSYEGPFIWAVNLSMY